MTKIVTQIDITISEGNAKKMVDSFKKKPGQKLEKKIIKALDNSLVFKKGSNGLKPINAYWKKLKEELQGRFISEDTDWRTDDPDWASTGEKSRKTRKRTSRYRKQHDLYEKGYSWFLTHLDTGTLQNNVFTDSHMDTSEMLIFEFGYTPGISYAFSFEKGDRKTPSYPLVRRTWKRHEEEFPEVFFEGFSINFKENFEK